MTREGVVGPPRRATDRASDTVVNAVARRDGTDPTALPPLFDAIEPDSLDALTSRADESDVLVSFQYAGYDVRVTGPTDVTVSVIDDLGDGQFGAGLCQLRSVTPVRRHVPRRRPETQRRHPVPLVLRRRLPRGVARRPVAEAEPTVGTPRRRGSWQSSSRSRPAAGTRSRRPPRLGSGGGPPRPSRA